MRALWPGALTLASARRPKLYAARTKVCVCFRSLVPASACGAEKEARAHRPTRLDTLLEPQIDKDGALRIARIRAPDRDPHITRALKTRARELQRLGLAETRARNVLAFSSNWREQLKAMEFHLDIRKQLMRSRAPTKTPKPKLPPMLGR